MATSEPESESKRVDCTICLEALECDTESTLGDARGVALACGHTFHARCISEWMRRSAKQDCPNCRAVHLAPASASTGATEESDIDLLFRAGRDGSESGVDRHPLGPPAACECVIVIAALLNLAASIVFSIPVLMLFAMLGILLRQLHMAVFTAMLGAFLTVQLTGSILYRASLRAPVHWETFAVTFTCWMQTLAVASYSWDQRLVAAVTR